MLSTPGSHQQSRPHSRKDSINGLSAGLLAKNAVEKGWKVKPWVKTSLAPGSQVVTDYLEKASLNKYLDQLGFNLVGYGCTTCIGNSGPLDQEISDSIHKENLYAVSVLSGNRNFEGRINPDVKANYLASPPLVVAYAIAGQMQFDLYKDPLGIDSKGKKIYLKDINLLDDIEKNKNNPFFLYYASPLPHVPLQAPKKWVNYYRNKLGGESPYTGKSYFPNLTPRATYAAMISYLDEQVGDIVAKLKYLGLYENTFIIFTSDNGPTYTGGADTRFFDSAKPFKSERGWSKGFLHEGGIRVPMIASWPGPGIIG